MKRSARARRFPSPGERAARVARLDDDARVGDEGHRPVPEREVLPLLGEPTGNCEMTRCSRMSGPGVRVLLRIDLVERRADDGDGPAAVREGRLVGGGVDALGEPAHDKMPRLARRPASFVARRMPSGLAFLAPTMDTLAPSSRMPRSPAT